MVCFFFTMDVGRFLRKLFGEPARVANIFLFGPNKLHTIPLLMMRGAGRGGVRRPWLGGVRVGVWVHGCGVHFYRNPSHIHADATAQPEGGSTTNPGPRACELQD